MLPKQPLSAFDLPLNKAIKPLHEEKKQRLFSEMENWRLVKNKGVGDSDLFPKINVPEQEPYSRSVHILNIKYIMVSHSVWNLMLIIKSDSFIH